MAVSICGARCTGKICCKQASKQATDPWPAPAIGRGCMYCHSHLAEAKPIVRPPPAAVPAGAVSHGCSCRMEPGRGAISCAHHPEAALRRVILFFSSCRCLNHKRYPATRHSSLTGSLSPLPFAAKQHTLLFLLPIRRRSFVPGGAWPDPDILCLGHATRSTPSKKPQATGKADMLLKLFPADPDLFLIEKTPVASSPQPSPHSFHSFKNACHPPNPPNAADELSPVLQQYTVTADPR